MIHTVIWSVGSWNQMKQFYAVLMGSTKCVRLELRRICGEEINSRTNLAYPNPNKAQCTLAAMGIWDLDSRLLWPFCNHCESWLYHSIFVIQQYKSRISTNFDSKEWLHVANMGSVRVMEMRMIERMNIWDVKIILKSNYSKGDIERVLEQTPSCSSPIFASPGRKMTFASF